jgi:nitric oxide reductase activation protein
VRTRDLATVVLLDVSESTRLGNVLNIERVAVALLADAMTRLGDPFALMASASDGRASRSHRRENHACGNTNTAASSMRIRC